MVDQVVRSDGGAPFQSVEILLPSDEQRNVVRLYADSCPPVQIPNSPDCHCLSFVVDGLPPMRHALFDVRNDSRGEHNLAGQDTPTSCDLERRLNKANGIELDFKRENFSHYKGYIGRGNNSALLF